MSNISYENIKENFKCRKKRFTDYLSDNAGFLLFTSSIKIK